MITFSFLFICFLVFLARQLELIDRKNPYLTKKPYEKKFSHLEEFWKLSFVFKGKTKRSDFWITQLFIFLIYIILVAIGICLFADINFGGGWDLYYFRWAGVEPYILMPIFTFSIVSLIPSISIQVRRLRDAAKTPWWILISFVPFIGGIVLLIFYLSPSRKKRLPMTLQDRLSEVEDLLKKGTIDEEEYKYMRKKILTKYVD